LIYALEKAGAGERELIETILRERSYDRVPFRQVRALIDRYQGFDRTQERAQAFTDKARQLIGEFPESRYQRALYEVTELVTDRDH